ncbi:hypothetical protein OLN43_17705 [Acinetobacter baumannii]|uniref:hypothetical protein n=1 Tax=Acinetobacter baumannii TaxID=470 RepID=UPI00222199AF|nr:hypothetical protein [Acinetobacter baumannii]MCW1491081.1 hypothetical protein [Acinetobacter baumannii]
MDKCREEFEQYIRSQSGFTADFQIGCNGQYKSDLMHFMFVTFQHQQAKVEELKASHHGEVIGHEVHFKKIKQERDELQKRVDAALKKLDKRRDELWSKWKGQADMQDQGAANAFEEAYWILEQALKGEG